MASGRLLREVPEATQQSEATANPLFQLLICRSDPKTGNTPTSVAGLGLGPALEPNCVAGVGLGAATEITTAEIEVEEAPRTRVDAALR